MQKIAFLVSTFIGIITPGFIHGNKYRVTIQHWSGEFYFYAYFGINSCINDAIYFWLRCKLCFEAVSFVGNKKLENVSEQIFVLFKCKLKTLFLKFLRKSSSYPKCLLRIENKYSMEGDQLAAGVKSSKRNENQLIKENKFFLPFF